MVTHDSTVAAEGPMPEGDGPSAAPILTYSGHLFHINLNIKECRHIDRVMIKHVRTVAAEGPMPEGGGPSAAAILTHSGHPYHIKFNYKE